MDRGQLGLDAARRVVADLGSQVDRDAVARARRGNHRGARRLGGAMRRRRGEERDHGARGGHDVLHPDVRTILEIGGQDSKIICVENGIAVTTP